MNYSSIDYAQNKHENNITKIRKSRFEQGDLLIHQQFARYGTNAREWTNKCALLLPEIERRKIWQKKGFKDIYEYAAKLAGMSRSTVDNALWALGKIEDRPALMKIAEEKGINAIKPVVTISTIESDSFWAEKARNMSMHDLETYVRDIRNGMEPGTTKTANHAKDDRTNQSNFLDNYGQNLQTNFSHNHDENPQVSFLRAEKPRPVKPTVTITMELDMQTAQKLEKIKGGGTWNEAMEKLLQIREQQLSQTKPQPAKTTSRHIPAEIKDFVTERDCNRCAFPRCNRPYSQLHHTQGFARENIHDPDRIFCLCFSHHSLAHQGLIENENMPPTNWKIREKQDENSQRFGIDRLVGKFKFAANS